mgnify:CR=1 FL=1
MILDEHKNEKNTNFAFYLYFLGQNRLNKGAFNNYVDQIWTNFDPLSPLEWTSVDILHPPPPVHVDKRRTKVPTPEDVTR